VSIILSVEFSDEKRRRSFKPDAELDPDLVAYWLRPLFPDLKLPDAADPEIEITGYPGWFQMRLTLYAGRRGVRSVYTEVWHTRRWYEGIDEHRSQLATLLVSPLLELARAGGARLLVDDPGIDMTDAEPADIAEYFVRPPTERGWSPPAAAADDAAMDDDVYLEQFLEAAGPRLQWLREQSAQTGGPAPEQLDFNRDSLVPLWSWAAPRFHRLHPGEQPTPGPKPVWIGRLGRTPQPGWTNESLELMDAILYYLGEALIRAVPGAHWAIYRSPDGRPTYHSGQAVIMGFGPAMDLEAYVSELASKTMFNPNDASVLQKEFDLMMSWATPRD
jgi:hypothetical protein